MVDPKSKTARQKQSDATRRAIMTAARRTMKKRGFGGTTIREVAKLAKVATGSVMSHFGSKEGLLYSVFYDEIQKIADDVFSSIDATKPLNEALKFVGDSFLDRYASEPELNADFLAHSLFAGGEWGQRFRAQVEQAGMQLAQLFRKAIEREEIDLQAAEMPLAVTTFFSNYYFVLIHQIKTKFSDVEQGKSQLRALIDHYYQGLVK